jgi:hypothetical protein
MDRRFRRWKTDFADEGEESRITQIEVWISRMKNKYHDGEIMVIEF